VRPNDQAQGSVLPRFPGGVATPAFILEALKAASGLLSPIRASAGRCVRGTYAPSDQAREITKSVSFIRPSRVLARFSVEGGNPETGAPRSELRGFSFRLGSHGGLSSILTQSAPFHFARTLDQMMALLDAHRPGPDGQPDRDRISAFLSGNPEAQHQADYLAAHPPPASLADTIYWGVHAFPATNAKGETRFIKFKVVPVGEQERPAGEGCIDLLYGELDTRVAARDVRFSVLALLDRPGDPVTDVTVRWPDEDTRDAVRLGTIVITGIEAREVCDAAIFDPAGLADGIGHPPDEIFAARCAVCAVSQAGRP
jgi:catalase